jgi:CheY-like chemotaxis protein
VSDEQLGRHEPEHERQRQDRREHAERALASPEDGDEPDDTTWPFAGGPRILVEHRDPRTSLELAGALRSAGCAVVICRGPDAEARCPVHELEPCAAVEGADVVVTALDFGDENGRQVLRGLRTRYPSTPLVVEATVGEAVELEDDLAGCTAIPVDAGASRVVRAVLDVLEP